MECVGEIASAQKHFNNVFKHYCWRKIHRFIWKWFKSLGRRKDDDLKSKKSIYDLGPTHQLGSFINQSIPLT